MDAQPANVAPVEHRRPSMVFTNCVLAIIAAGVWIMTMNSMSERAAREDYRKAVEADLLSEPFTSNATRAEASNRARWAAFGLGGR